MLSADLKPVQKRRAAPKAASKRPFHSNNRAKRQQPAPPAKNNERSHEPASHKAEPHKQEPLKSEPHKPETPPTTTYKRTPEQEKNLDFLKHLPMYDPLTLQEEENVNFSKELPGHDFEEKPTEDEQKRIDLFNELPFSGHLDKK